MASRVHDSVLQTLALIQRRATDPQQVIQLARAQERELRSWLFDGHPPGSMTADTTFAAGVRQHPERRGGAARRHRRGRHRRRLPDRRRPAGTPRRRPRGNRECGEVVERRRSSRSTLRWSRRRCRCSSATAAAASIRRRCRLIGRASPTRSGARMVRRGGTAEVRSAPGEGTEIRLSMPRSRGRPASSCVTVPVAPRPRVFIVDDHGLFRSGVRSELGTHVDVIGEADDVEPAIAGIVDKRARRRAPRRASPRRRRPGRRRCAPSRRIRTSAFSRSPPRTRRRT